MTFPLIDRIYLFEGEEVCVDAQTLFYKVYLRTIPKEGGGIYSIANWWKFMLNAKYLKDLPKVSSAY